jgi:thiamine phosphate synthase YjbQ (UPF0047 family)
MKLEIQSTTNPIVVDVYDNIKSVSDSDRFKNCINELLMRHGTTKVTVNIKDSYILTSSIIGFLAKKIAQEHAPITIHVKNSELYRMLTNLQVIELLNIKR